MSEIRHPKVSIVVPCYNGARFIDSLVATFAAQTFRDFEVVIVDDGSNAETQAKLATLDPSIRVIRQENRGLSAARNAGFRAAHADLILPLDCDDRLDPSYLAETVAAMDKAGSNVGLVYTHLSAFGDIEGVFQRRFHPFDLLFSNKLPATVLMRRAAWSALGGYDETMRDGYEDWDFNIRIANSGFRAVEVSKPLFFYRVSKQGMLLSHCTAKHASIWRGMRTKNRKFYRLPALMRSWWETRATSRIPLPLALGILALAQLPDQWFNAIMGGFRHTRLHIQSWRSPSHSPDALAAK